MEKIISAFNKKAEKALCNSLGEILKERYPVFICIGSDLVLGDSLGPLVGTLLKKKYSNALIYGTLNYPITAKEISYAKEYISKAHPNSLIIAIDAAIGEEDDIGLIKIRDRGIKPGLGVDKDLEEIGDISIISIVASKSQNHINLYNLTRLNLVYKVAETISNGIDLYLKQIDNMRLFNIASAK